MRKTSVHLSEELAERLARIAREEGRSQADVLRAAIAQYRPPRSRDRELSLYGCVRGSGSSIADVAEDDLLRGFGSIDDAKRLE